MRCSVVVAASMSVLLAACTATVTGTPSVALRSDPPTAARPLDEVLPTAGELAAALGIGQDGYLGPLVEGGADTLLAGVDQSEATPVECVSATYRLQRVVYAASPVSTVVTRSWAGGGPDGPSSTAFVGVVKLASADDARAFFAATADKWRACDGRTMVLYQADRAMRASTRITDVTVGDRVVSAVLLNDPGSGGATIERALGVGSDCIVDVEVTGVGVPGGATDIAGLMLRKVTGS